MGNCPIGWVLEWAGRGTGIMISPMYRNIPKFWVRAILQSQFEGPSMAFLNQKTILYIGLSFFQMNFADLRCPFGTKFKVWLFWMACLDGTPYQLTKGLVGYKFDRHHCIRNQLRRVASEESLEQTCVKKILMVFHSNIDTVLGEMTWKGV